MPLVAQKNHELDFENHFDGMVNPLAKGQLERTIEPSAVGQEAANPIAEVAAAQNASLTIDEDPMVGDT